MEKGEERKWKERLDKEGAKNRKVKKKKKSDNESVHYESLDTIKRIH